MEKFRAYRIDEQDGKIVAGFQHLTVDDLTDGGVLIEVSHSTINFKDALAATGSAKIVRRYPLNGGIDLAGTVVSSDDADFQPGTTVLVNGCGLSETVDGGYSQFARVDSDSVVPVPEGMTAKQAMQIGTAGYTAALAVHRLEQNGQLPENGPIVVAAKKNTSSASVPAGSCVATRSTLASGRWKNRYGPVRSIILVATI
jgi:NADPH2:quinone reductase